MGDWTADAIENWLGEVLLPGWLARVHDPRRPGFAETTTPEGQAIESEVRTTLVTARLIYVFSHAHLIGVPGALAAARHGMDFLWTGCRRGDGRFSHRCVPDGTPLDDKSDLYDLAFVLFACGWFARASGETIWLERAEAVMGFVETELAHPAGGFAEDTLGTLPRRQNPHMHLLEACHALAESGGGQIWLDRAEALVGLMRRRMLDEAGALAEFFTADWRLADGPRGLIREPGHHYEWTWLLHHHARLTGHAAAHADADRLFAVAERHRGAPSHGCIVNEIAPDGTVLDGQALLWPQTEYLKALGAQIEFAGDAGAAAMLDIHLALIFARFVDRDSGLWVNRIDEAGQPIAAPIPVRVLYHLVLGLAEAARVKRLARAG